MIKYIFKILILTLIFNITVYGDNIGNIKIKSFSKAKKILKNKIYNDKKLQYGIYSQCSYESKKIKKKNGKYRYKLVVNKKSCGYTPRTKSKRANYIEWEHIVPATFKFSIYGQY